MGGHWGFGTARGVRWLGGNVVGFALGGLLGGAVAKMMEEPHIGVRDPVVAARVLALNGAVALVIFGTVIGLFQWFMLRVALTDALWWVPSTALGWAVAGGIAGGLSGLLGGSVTDVGPQRGALGFVVAAGVGALSLGFLPAAGQWLVLRATSDRALAWIPAHATALVAGAIAAFPLMLLGDRLFDLEIPSGPAWTVAGAVLGLVFGLVTLPVLGRIFDLSATVGQQPGVTS
jgi:hypothetical protein